jgi:glucosamine--fructose-6-phosphate aminotransferase (isomerizing)
VFILPNDEFLAKNLSTIAEIQARKGPILAIKSRGASVRGLETVFETPASEAVLEPILLNIPLQLLAYHVAHSRGCDIDQPRNLAKSVTVQ